MDQLIPSLANLLEPLGAAFRAEAFAMFHVMVGAWIACLGRHKPEPTFADMLATCRLHLWRHWLDQRSLLHADIKSKWRWLLEYVATAA